VERGKRTCIKDERQKREDKKETKAKLPGNGGVKKTRL